MSCGLIILLTILMPLMLRGAAPPRQREPMIGKDVLHDQPTDWAILGRFFVDRGPEASVIAAEVAGELHDKRP
jgi:hypothetical protein